ncbi:hypothetical protein AB1Y20_015564 [Prymnesium parvum]|uniref:EngB-type G domain-containing protein n=1 Tax=Prymnesium parvum TaxID=97485 RepID=A0AB34K0U1_PRYPA
MLCARHSLPLHRHPITSHAPHGSIPTLHTHSALHCRLTPHRAPFLTPHRSARTCTGGPGIVPSIVCRIHRRWRRGSSPWKPRSPLSKSAVGRTSREEEKTAAEREAYAARLAEVEYGAWDPEVMEDIEAYKLGRIHGCYNPKLVMQRRHRKAGLYVKEAAVHDVEELPQLNGIDDLPLPEVAVCGASNAGKSSLLNALLSADATVGPAAVCSRPGWTRSIQLFKLYETRYEDGLMCLADCPGYGTALASKEDRMQWARTMRDYLRKRQQCTGVFVLIDCSRGVTEDDERFMTLIDSTEKKFHCVLTKADLLTPVQLAQSNVLVAEAATKHPSYAGGDIPMCSANNHAGVAELYRRLRTGLRHFANNRRHTELRNLPNQQVQCTRWILCLKRTSA